MQVILINQQPVELHKILKFEGLVASGGEAKQVIAAEMVEVNGEVETRKRRKMLVGDVIVFQAQEYRLELES